MGIVAWVEKHVLAAKMLEYEAGQQEAEHKSDGLRLCLAQAPSNLKPIQGIFKARKGRHGQIIGRLLWIKDAVYQNFIPFLFTALAYNARAARITHTELPSIC